jgi:Zn-dependent protease
MPKLKKAGGFLLALIILTVVIATHEAGHLFAALMTGVPVNTYSIGIGPTLLSTEWHGVTYQLAAIPLGGYCEIADGQVTPYIALMGPIAGYLSSIPFGYVVAHDLLDIDRTGWTRGQYIGYALKMGLGVPLVMIAAPVILPVLAYKMWKDKKAERKLEYHENGSPKQPDVKVIPEGGYALHVEMPGMGSTTYRFETAEDRNLYKQYVLERTEWHNNTLKNLPAMQNTVEAEDPKPEPKQDKVGSVITVLDDTTKRVSSATGGMDLLNKIAIEYVLMAIGINILNLFPVPPLDGAHIVSGLLHIPEGVRDVLWGVGTILFVGYMLYLLVRDAWKLIKRWRSK